MRALFCTPFLLYVISTQLLVSGFSYQRESYTNNIRRCDDGEQWRPLDNNNTTNTKEKEESSDLVIGSDSHEDCTLQVQGNTDNRYQPHSGTSGFAHNNVNEYVKLVPFDKMMKVPSNQRILSPIPVPVPIQVMEPFQLAIPVPVKVENERIVPVEKIVYHQVVKPVPMKVVKEVRVPVPQPYPVYYPVYKLKLVVHTQDGAHPATNYHEY